MQRRFNIREHEALERQQEPSELAANLENLRKLNACLGSHRLIRWFLRRWFAGAKKVRLLDLCTGSAGIPRMIVDWGRKEGVHFEIDAVESRPATAEIARNQSREYPEIHIVEADAFDFAPTDLYDAGFCSLALHQFSEEDALRVLSRLKAVVHGPVLVADLERSWSAAAGMWLVAAVWWRSHGVREEVRSSVRGAFSFDELAELARRAGWDGSMQKRFLFARQAIWIDPMPLTPVEPSSFLAISPAAP